MSDVDKRVVQMDFDNKKFERNVKESTESIGKLKKSLNFDGVSNSIDQVSVKIKTLEVVTTTALVNITNRVVNLGIQMIKSLSVDNISAGWAKYGQKTTSVATMMAQNFKVAGKELTDTSEKMNVVNDQLERLNWFSDETSYTFTDMVDNVGKFIAAGQDLDVSVKAMEGIATWAALSGQNALTASRAMYQLSQAMGKGKIQLIDYKSIQNANMDTVEFRQTILDAAIALGQLTKEGDKFVTKTGKKFTQNQFAEELGSGWFTSEVLVKGLSKYSSAVEQIYELANKEGLTASEVIEKYGDDLDTFGLKAFKAAQEARTFADVLSSVRDAVSSKWMTTSELIFGDKNESVSLWTDLSNALYEVFAESGNFRNEILKVWKSLSGREDLFKHGEDDQGAFWNIYDAIVNLKDLIKSAWNTIFPLSEMEDESAQAQDIGNKLKTLTGNLKAFTKRLQMSEATSLRLRKIFEGLFSVVKFGIQVLKAIRYVVDPIFETIKQLSSIIIDKLIYSIGKLEINANGIMQFTDKIAKFLTNIFEPLLDLLRGADILSNFSNYFGSFINTSNDQILDLGNVFEKTFAIVTRLFQIIASIPSLINSLSKKITGNDIVTNLYLLFNGILDIINNFVNNKKSDISKGNNILSPLEYFLDGLCTLLSGILSVSRLVLMLLGKAFSAIGSILSKVGELFIGIIQGTSNISKLKLTFIIIGGIILGILIVILNTVKNIGWMITALKNPFAVIADSVSGLIDKLSLKMMADAIKTFATSALLIAASLLIISSISKENLLRSLFTLTIVVGVLAGVLFLMIKMSDLIEESSKNIFQLAKKSAMLRSLSYAMSVISSSFLKIAVAFYIVGKLSESQMENGFNLMTAIILYQFILIKILSNTKVDAKKIFPTMKQLIGMSILLLAFGKTIKVISSIDWLSGLYSVIYISVFLAAFAVAMISLNKFSEITSSKEKKVKAAKLASEILSMSILLLAFAKTIKVISSIDWLSGLYSVIYISVFLAAFAVAMFSLNKFSEITSSKGNKVKAAKLAPEILAMSILLLAFGKTIKVISSIDWVSGLYSVIYISAFLAAFAGAMIALNKNPKSKSTNKILRDCISMSILLLAFGKSMAMLSTVPWQNILAAVTGLDIVLLSVLGIEAGLTAIGKSGVDILKDMAGISGGVLLLSASLSILSAAFQAFSNIGWESIGKGAAVVAGSFVLFGVAATILQGIIPTILLLSSAIVLLGAGMALSATSILLVIYALKELSTMSVESIQTTTDKLNALEELIATALLAGLQSLFEGISALLPSLFGIIETFIDETLGLLNDKIPAIADTALGLIDKLLADIKEKSSSIFNSIFGIIGNFFSELTKDSKLEKLTEDVSKMIVQIFNGIAKKADDIVGSILNFILSLVKGIFNNRQLLSDIVSQVLNLIMDLLVKIVKSIVQLAGAIAKVILILIAAAFRIVIASLGGLASLFLEFISAVLLILVHTIIGMTDVIYQVFKTIVYNLINIFNKVLMDVGPMLAVWLKTGFQSLLAGILEAIAILIKDVPVVGALYDSIHNAAENMKSSVKNTMDEYADIMRGDNVLTAVRNATTNIRYVVKESSSQIKSTLTDSIGDINDAVADSSEELSKSMNDFAKGFQMNTNEGQKQSEKAGKDITEGLKNGIEDNIDDVKKAGAAAGEAAVDGAREETDTHSPSRVMFKLGQYLVDGLSLGITDKKDEAVDSMTKMVTQAINATQDTIENQNGDDLTLKVGLDISGVEAQSRKITDIMSGINNVEATAYGRNALYTAKRLNKRASSEDKTVTQDDHSSTVTYNNVFNVNSTDPERSAEEIDKALSRQAARARLARGAV